MPARAALAALFALVFTAAGAENVDSYLDRAGRYLDQDDREAAIRILKTIPVNQNGGADVWFRIGVFLHQRGLEQAAREYAQLAVSARANRADYLFLLGSILVELKEFTEAASLLEPLARIDKTPAAMDALMGRVYTGTRAYKKAVASFERAIAKQPGDPSFRVQLAHVYLWSGKPEEATQQLRLARSAFQASPALNQKLNELELSLAAGALGQGEPAIARLVLAEAKQHSGDEEPFRLLQANLLQLENQNEEAIRYLQQTFLHFPDSSQIPFAIGLSHYNIGRFREALTWFQTAAQRAPRLAQALHYQGLCHANLRDFEAAETFQRQAVALDAHNDLYRYQLGWVLLRLGKGDAAEEQFRKILRASPDYVPALTELGRLLLQNGTAADAIPFLERAVEKEDRLDQAYYLLSQAYRRQGQREQADVWLSKFRQLKDFERSERTRNGGGRNAGPLGNTSHDK